MAAAMAVDKTSPAVIQTGLLRFISTFLWHINAASLPQRKYRRKYHQDHAARSGSDHGKSLVYKEAGSNVQRF
jgi:hypothetical protein